MPPIGQRRDGAPVRGIWWKSLLAAWVASQAIGAIAVVAGVEAPPAAGVPALVLLWAFLWFGWRRKVLSAAAAGRSMLQGMQRLTHAFAIAIALIGVLVVVLAADGLDFARLPQAPVAAVVVAVGAACTTTILLRRPKLHVGGGEAPDVVGGYRSRFFLRLAIAELPALVGFIAVFLTSRAWVFAPGLVASLAGFAAGYPTTQRVAIDSAELQRGGASVDLATVLSADPVTPG